jgi:hypothetical protein
MLRQQAIRPQPPAAVASVARDFKRGKTGRDLAKIGDTRHQLHRGLMS